jgi:hypothetical protein
MEPVNAESDLRDSEFKLGNESVFPGLEPHNEALKRPACFAVLVLREGVVNRFRWWSVPGGARSRSPKRMIVHVSCVHDINLSTTRDLTIR